MKAFLVCGLMCGTAAWGQGAGLAMRGTMPQESLHIVVGQSLMLRGTSAMKRVFVGNPAVLQSFSASPEEMVLTAKAAGVSSLAVWDVNGAERLYTVSADVDATGMRRALTNVYPDAAVSVDGVEDRLTLSGTVGSSEVAEGILKLAAVYAKVVANSLRVVPARARQVELKLKIIEVDRTKLDQFGVNLNGAGKVPYSSSTQQFNNPLNLAIDYLRQNINVNVQDLEQRQILQVLAEPTLTTISGLPARFLSGGEFPVPVAQTSSAGTSGAAASSAITIQFKAYGVKVDFTPTVNGDGSIRLKVAPEVSTLDFANGVTISGFTVPALSTRRAETEVEIKDGQSFVLSGLLDRRTTLSLGSIPGIASVPVLGHLFRSKNNNHSVVELMVIVTAHVVNPLQDTLLPGEPQMSVPNMTREGFDTVVHKIPSASKQP